MSPVAFDTLELAQRLEAAGFPPKQAQDVARALSETIGDVVVTRDYLDLRLDQTRSEIDLRFGEIRATMATKVELAEAKGRSSNGCSAPSACRLWRSSAASRRCYGCCDSRRSSGERAPVDSCGAHAAH